MLCCTFCGHDEERAMLLIAGPNHTAICDECVALCVMIIDEKMARTSNTLVGALDSQHER